MENYLSEILTVLATLVAAFWAAYKWFVTKPKDKAELEIRKQRLEIEKEFPYIEFDFTINICEQEDQHTLLVHAHATNKGKRIAECIIMHDEILTVVEVKAHKSGINLGSHQYAQYLKLEHGVVDSWAVTTIVPGATKTFPFAVFVESPGIYYVQIKLKMGEKNEEEVRKKFASDSTKPVYWSGSTYIHVP